MKRRIIALAFALMLVCMLSSCGLTVPRPEIKTGEFEFSVTYEYLGEINTISGVYVCEYNGMDWALDGGYHRDWSGYIEGVGKDDHIEIGTTNDDGTIILSLSLYPEYFMGESIDGLWDPPAPYIMVQYPYDDIGGMQFITEEDVIAERYGARLISYEYASPIENTFSIVNF